MPSTFKVEKVSAIKSRKMFLLIGSVISGYLENGMRIKIINDNIDILIHSIEMINSKFSNELIGLTFINISAHEIEFLEGLLPGTIILIE